MTTENQNPQTRAGLVRHIIAALRRLAQRLGIGGVLLLAAILWIGLDVLKDHQTPAESAALSAGGADLGPGGGRATEEEARLREEARIRNESVSNFFSGGSK